MTDIKDIETNEESDIITLLNDEDKEVNFYHIATVDYNENWYILLEPVEITEDFEEDEMLIFRIAENEDGEEDFLPLESEEEMNGVYNEYVKLVEEDEAACECDDESECGDSCGCGCKAHSDEEACDCDDESECDDSCDCGCKTKK